MRRRRQAAPAGGDAAGACAGVQPARGRRGLGALLAAVLLLCCWPAAEGRYKDSELVVDIEGIKKPGQARIGPREGGRPWPSRGSGATVTSIESPEGAWPPQQAGGVIRLPLRPRHLGRDSVRFLVRGTGLWNGMMFTLQPENETRCSSMWNLNRNHSWVAAPFVNYTTGVGHPCPRGGCFNVSVPEIVQYPSETAEATPTYTTTPSDEVSATVTHTPSLSESRTSTLSQTYTATETATPTSPPIKPPSSIPDYYPFNFGLQRRPVATTEVSEDGTTAMFYVPIRPYFERVYTGFIFCFQPNYAPTRTQYMAYNENRTGDFNFTQTMTMEQPFVDFSVDSRIEIQTYGIREISGPFGQARSYNKTSATGDSWSWDVRHDQPPYRIEFGSTPTYSVTAHIPWGWLLAAFSSDPWCGNVPAPLGWDPPYSQAAAGWRNDPAVGSSRYGIGFVVDAMNISADPDTSDVYAYKLYVSQPESVRWEVNNTLTLCAKPYPDWPYFHPFYVGDPGGPVEFVLQGGIVALNHLYEMLSPTVVNPIGPQGFRVAESWHNATVRMLVGKTYQIDLVGQGFWPFMRLGINETCDGVGPPRSANQFSYSQGNVFDSAPIVLDGSSSKAHVTFVPRRAGANLRLCLSLTGPRVPAQYAIDLGFGVTVYRVMGINSLWDGSSHFRFPYGTHGPQWLPSENIEPHVRIKFEGGDGVGKYTGDEWPASDCSLDEEETHHPSTFYFADPGYWDANMLDISYPMFHLNYSQSSRWQTNVMVCIATYPWAHSKYELLPFRVNFTSTFTNATFQDRFITPPERLFVYEGYQFSIFFYGDGLWPHMRLAISSDISGSTAIAPCTNALVYFGSTEPALFDRTNAEHTWAELTMPAGWVDGTTTDAWGTNPSTCTAAYICMSQYYYGLDFSWETGWRLNVMRLRTIESNTHVDITYGADGTVFNIVHKCGEVGMEIAFASDCSEVRKTCDGSTAVTSEDCALAAAGDPTAEAKLAGCLSNPLGVAGGYSQRLSIASAVPLPGTLFFVYHCQTARHQILQKVCLSPYAGGWFRDTGLTANFLVTVNSIETDTQTVQRYGTVYYLKGSAPTIKLKGSGLYPYMRLAAMPNCSKYTALDTMATSYVHLDGSGRPTNRSTLETQVPWTFVVNSDKTDYTELQFVPPVALTAQPLYQWELCMSEFAQRSEYWLDFSIQIGFRVTVVELQSINFTDTPVVSYGDRMLMSLQGVNLFSGIQIKFHPTDCSRTAPSTDFCTGTLGEVGATGCRQLADTLCYPVPRTGLQQSGVWFFLLQTMSSQHQLNLKTCLNVWPRPNQRFYETSVRMSFLINVMEAQVQNQVLRNYETILLYRGHNDFTSESLNDWPAGAPQRGRVAEIALRGIGFRSTFRVKFQEFCGVANYSHGGPAIVVRPAQDTHSPPRDESMCGRGDRLAYLDIKPEHVSQGTPNYRMCFSQLAQGTDFSASSNFYFGVVELTTVSFSAQAHATLPYGFVGDLVLYGTSLAPFMLWKIDHKLNHKPNSVPTCEGPDFEGFQTPLQFLDTGGTPRCQPDALGRCERYQGRGDRRFDGGYSGLVRIGHQHTFRQVQNMPICLSIWGSRLNPDRTTVYNRFYRSLVTITTEVKVSSVESYGKHHYASSFFHEDVYVYMRYPSHVITLHGYGFYEHHRVAWMQGGCGTFNASRPSYAVLGPSPVNPVELPDNATLRTTPTADGRLRTAALVYFEAVSNLTNLHGCYSVFPENDPVNKWNFSLPLGVRLTTVDLKLLKIVGVDWPIQDKLTIWYGQSATYMLGGNNLIPKTNTINQFLFNFDSDCDSKVTLGVATPATLIYQSTRDPLTQKLIPDVASFSLPTTATLQYSTSRKLCFSPYKSPFHKFLDTGYRADFRCAAPHKPCTASGTAGICDVNATQYQQLVQGCTCSFRERTNYSCVLPTQNKCNETTTCSGHGLCLKDSELCECTPGYYGPACTWCQIEIAELHYSDSLKHLTLSFHRGYTNLLEVASERDLPGGKHMSCRHLLPPADILQLGNPECFWTAPNVLHIFAGYGARVPSEVRVDTAGINAFCSESGAGPSPYVIPFPHPEPVPRPVLLVPKIIGPCDGVVLDASLSWGPAGELTYFFRIENHTGFAFPEELVMALRNRPDPGNPLAFIPADRFPVGRYDVTLSVLSRVLKYSADTTETIEKCGTNACAGASPTDPVRLVVMIPQPSTLRVPDTQGLLEIGPTEISGDALIEYPLGAHCISRRTGVVYNAPERKDYIYNWTVWWRPHRGDVYLADIGNGQVVEFVENAELGDWKQVYLSEQTSSKPTLFLPLFRRAAQDASSAIFPVNRSAKANVTVSLLADYSMAPFQDEAEFVDEPWRRTVVARGNAEVAIIREDTILAYFKGGNRTVAGNFTIELNVRLSGKSGLDGTEFYFTEWWCNDTTNGRLVQRCQGAVCVMATAECPPILRVDPRGQAVQYSFGPPTTGPLPLGRFLFSARYTNPRVSAAPVAVCEIEIVDGAGALDVGIVPENTTLSLQHLAHSQPIAVMPVILSQPLSRDSTFRYRWSMRAGSRPLPFGAGINPAASLLVAPPFTFLAGGTYQLQLLVSELNPAGKVLRQATPTFDLQCLTPPHGGRLVIGPELDHGERLLQAQGWTVETERLPLVYKFWTELGCKAAADANCPCCFQGVRANVGDACLKICSSCSCGVLADFGYRPYVYVTLPRTLRPANVTYYVSVRDARGVEHERLLNVSTEIEVVDPGTGTDGGGATDCGLCNGRLICGAFRSNVDCLGLEQLTFAVDRQDVSRFLLNFAELTSSMLVLIQRQFIEVVCPTATRPATPTETPSLTTATPSMHNGSALMQPTATVPPRPNLTATIPWSRWAPGQTPTASRTMNVTSVTRTLPLPPCRAIIPSESDTPLLPFFPKSKAMAYQMEQMAASATRVVGSLSTPEHKIRILELMDQATQQPALVSRAAAGTFIDLAGSVLRTNSYLNDPVRGFHTMLTKVLGQILLATVTTLPDNHDPTSGEPVDEALRLLVREQKKQQIKQVQQILDDVQGVIADEVLNVQVGQQFEFEGGGIKRVCKRANSRQMLPESEKYALSIDPLTGLRPPPLLDPAPHTVFSQCSSDAAVAAARRRTGECGANATRTNLTFRMESNFEPFASRPWVGHIDNCVTHYPVLLHDWAAFSENATGDYTVSYSIYDENRTTIHPPDSFVILTLPMDSRLLALVNDSKRNDVRAACYWFDAQPPCGGHFSRAACESQCCLDATSPWRVRECEKCCKWTGEGGYGVPPGQGSANPSCVPGERAGLDTLRTDGCTVTSWDKSKIVCNCSHMTDFVQGYIPVVPQDPFEPLLIPPPNRLVEALPMVAAPRQPNLLALPQVLAFGILYVVFALWCSFRERRFRTEMREKIVGGRVHAPWRTALSDHDKLYTKQVFDSDTGKKDYRFVRELGMGAALRQLASSDEMYLLLAVVKAFHSYANIIFLQYNDNRTTVQKLTALFCGISSAWALCARLWRNADDEDLTANNFMAYSFASACLIGPCAYILSIVFATTPRRPRPRPGAVVRAEDAEARTRKRLGHRRIWRQMLADNEAFYRGSDEQPTGGVTKAAKGLFGGDDRKKHSEAGAHGAPMVSEIGAGDIGYGTGEGRDMLGRQIAKGIMRAQEQKQRQSGRFVAFGGEVEFDTEHVEVAGIDLVVRAMDPWQRPAEDTRRVLRQDPSVEQVELHERLVVGPHLIGEGGDEDEDDFAATGPMGATRSPAVEPAEAPPEPEQPEEEEEGAGVVLTRSQLQEAGMYETKCGRFIVAVHMFFMADYFIQLQRFRETAINQYDLLTQAKHQVTRYAMLYFGMDIREFSVQFAFQEWGNQLWQQGIESLRHSSNLYQSANFFFQYFERFPAIKNSGLLKSVWDVKCWVYHYYLKTVKDKGEGVLARHDARENFDAMWAQSLADQTAITGSITRAVDWIRSTELNEVLDLSHASFGFPEDKRFTRIEVLQEIVDGNYLRAEFMVMFLQPGEVLGSMRSTGEPGEFEEVEGVDMSDVLENAAGVGGEEQVSSLLRQPKFWVQYFAHAAKGVTSEVFEQMYEMQLSQMRTKQRQKKIQKQRAKEAAKTAADGTIQYIPDILEGYRDRSEEDEELLEGEEASARPPPSERDREELPPDPADDDPGGLHAVQAQLDDLFQQWGQRNQGLDDLDDQNEDVRAAQKLRETQMVQLEQGRVRFGNTLHRRTLYVCTRPRGFRSTGAVKGCGDGTLENPYGTLAYAIRLLRLDGFPPTNLHLLGGIYPPMRIVGLRDCDITCASRERVKFLGRFAWEPVLTLENCRNVKLYGCMIDHGSVAIDASKSINVFAYDNVITDVDEGILNPNFGEIEQGGEAKLDLNFCNYIFPRFVKQAPLRPYRHVYYNYVACVAVGALSAVYWIRYALDFDDTRLGFFYGSTYAAIGWDFFFIQPFYCYWRTQRDKWCSRDAWRDRMDHGPRPGQDTREDLQALDDDDD